MADQYLGLSSSGTLELADTPSFLSSPFQLSDAGGLIVSSGGTSVGYLYITDDGFLGIGDGPTSIVQVSCGSNHSLFLLSDGTVYSCGLNAYGQLGRAAGNGSETTVNLGQITALSGVSGVSAGSNHSLFVLSDGTVYSCGINTYGQLGRAAGNGSETTVNLGQIIALSGVSGVSAGSNHSLFVLSDGTVYSCGRNTWSQLGRAVLDGSETTVNLGQITALSGISVISGGNHSLFLLPDGTVYSCGINTYGQLGRVASAGSPTTVNLGQITALSGVSAISGGSNHSLFVLSNGTTYSCGVNTWGQLGRAVLDGSETTVNIGQITALSGVSGVSGGSNHSLFVLSDGTVYSCGFNIYGQLGRVTGDGSPTTTNLGQIPNLHNISTLGAGEVFALFATPDDKVYSCGRNNYGELGRAVSAGSPSSVNLGEIQFI